MTTAQKTASTITVKAPFDGRTIDEVPATDSAGVNAASRARSIHAARRARW